MPRTRTATDSRPATRRRRTSRTSGDSRGIVEQITQLVTANEALQRENRELVEENQRLRTELMQIGSALGRLTGGGGGPRGRRGRRGAEFPLTVAPDARPRRQRKPITDPEALEKRRQALVRARAVRAERLAAARAAGGEGAAGNQ